MDIITSFTERQVAQIIINTFHPHFDDENVLHPKTELVPLSNGLFVLLQTTDYTPTMK